MAASPSILLFGGSYNRAITDYVEAYPHDDLACNGIVNILKADRQDFTVAALPNKEILVMGGRRHDYALNSTEIYSPVTKQWREGPPMVHKRYCHASTFLSISGLVYVCGGLSSEGYLDSAEIYNWRTNEWTLVAQMPFARAHHVACSLEGGDVLIAGGIVSIHETIVSMSTVIYLMFKNRYRYAACMHYPRTNAAACILPDGNVMITGGTSSTFFHDALSSTEIYDIKKDQWRVAPSLPTPLYSHTATCVDNTVYVLGGCQIPYCRLDTAFKYKIQSKRWESTYSISSGRVGHQAIFYVHNE